MFPVEWFLSCLFPVLSDKGTASHFECDSGIHSGPAEFGPLFARSASRGSLPL